MTGSTDIRPAIAAAVIVMDGKLLLARRQVAERELLWQFPAGKIEPGETAEATAVRETYEEVGLVVEPMATIGERIHPATGRAMVYVACSVVRGEAYAAAGDEIAEVVWCTRAQISNYVPHGFHESVQDYLEANVAQ